MKQKDSKKGIAFVLVCVMVLSMGMFTMSFAADSDNAGDAGSAGDNTTGSGITTTSTAVTTPAATTTTPGATTSGGAVTPGAVTPGAVTTPSGVVTPSGTTTPEGFVFDAEKGVSQFADAKDNAMANFIDVLIKKDIIRGYEDGTYKPENQVTTAELLSLLMKAAGQTSVTSGAVTDDWATQVMQKAYDLKIVTEEEMPKTEGDKNISRGNMSLLLVRVSEVLLEEEKITVENPADYIRDYAEIPANLQEYVAQAYMKGFVTGDNSSSFNAADNATRAEAAVIVSRVIDKALRAAPEVFSK